MPPRPVPSDATYSVELQEIEDRHFRFRSRNRVIRAIVERFASPLGSQRRWALEIGCGTGNVLRVFEEAHHCRPYRQADLLASLERCGFELVHSTHFMTALFPLVWLRRCAAGFRRGPDPEPREALRPRDLVLRELRVGRALSLSLGALLTPEEALLDRGGSLPFSTSLIAVARKGRE